MYIYNLSSPIPRPPHPRPRERPQAPRLTTNCKPTYCKHCTHCIRWNRLYIVCNAYDVYIVRNKCIVHNVHNAYNDTMWTICTS